MDAKSFFEKFTNRIYSSKDIIEKYWKTDYSTFTEFIMTDIIDKIIKEKKKKKNICFHTNISGSMLPAG